MPRSLRGTRLGAEYDETLANSVAGQPVVRDGLQFFAPFHGDSRAHIKNGEQVYTAMTTETVDSDGSYNSPYAPGRYVIGATSNTARVSANGLISEPTEINKFIYARDLSNAAWVVTTNGSKGSNVTTSPDNTTDGDSIIEDATVGGTFAVKQAFTVPSFTGSYMTSFYAKAGTRDFIRFAVALTTSVTVDFNLATGVVCASSNDLDSGMEDEGNGWYRCWAKAAVVPGDAGSQDFVFTACDTCGSTTYTGINTDDAVYLWSFSLAQGSLELMTATDTVAAAVTRAEDVYEFLNEEIATGTAFTIFFTMECVYNVNPTSDRFAFFNDFDATNFISILLFRTTGVISAQMVVGGATQFGALGSTPVTRGRHTIALCVDTNDMRGYLDAGEEMTDTSVTLPTSVGTHNRIAGSPTSANKNLSSPMSNLCIYNRALTATEITLLDNQYR